MSFLSFAQSDTLHVNYFVDAPFASTENNRPSGIEIDIISEYVLWLKTKKNMNVAVSHHAYTDYGQFYASVKSAPKNTIGLGAVIITPEKAKDVDLSTGYLKNVSFCITNGNAPDIKAKTQPEIIKALGNMTALTIPNTNLAKYIGEIKKTYIPDLKVKEYNDQVKMLEAIAANVLNFAYIDAIDFWFFLKNNPQKFLKMQKPLNQAKEELGYIMPKGSQHKVLFNEFFSGATGFKTTRNYRAILEKYVGSYMTQNMAIN